MTSVHRIVRPRFEAAAWTGEGAAKHGGRWNHPGRPVVYCGGSLALAAMEMLVHLDRRDLLATYRHARVDVDPSLVLDLPADALPPGWGADAPGSASRDLGDGWLRDGQSVALRVPSVVVPGELNVLLNPRHADFARLTFGEFVPFRFDPRLLKR